jgi:lysophospholipase L1-like esterase
LLSLFGAFAIFAGHACHAADDKKAYRVAIIGSTLLEQEQKTGYLETLMHLAFADQNVQVRNLAWSGDTVFGDSRAGFQTAKEGYQRLLDVVKEFKPNRIYFQYGFNESFQGEAGLTSFLKQYEKLLKDLSPLKAEFSLIAPIGATGPQAKNINPNVDLYRKAIGKFAADQGVEYLELTEFDTALRASQVGTLTTNGIHLTEEGYKQLAESLKKQELPSLPALDWQKLAPLRQAIVAKNQAVFYRWRPQNETYLFGFRKHEQGKNAQEVFAFDPIIAELDAKIHPLKK